LQVSRGWRHCILLQNIVLLKVCHPELNIITHVWPAVACKGTSVLIHQCIAFSGPCPQLATSLCLSWALKKKEICTFLPDHGRW
jgi:hypothetical protein